jgi:hypothetical protein
MEDRKLMELAAKAAGYKINWLAIGLGPYFMTLGGEKEWNPLEDDGDAFRLAVKMGMVIRVNDMFRGVARNCAHAHCAKDELNPEIMGMAYIDEPHNDNPYAAVRRAIVLAAAQKGKYR